MVKLRLQLELLVTQIVQMLPQVGDVGFEHHVDVGAGGGLFLQKFPLGFKHLVLLFQEPHLLRETKLNLENVAFFIFLYWHMFVIIIISTHKWGGGVGGATKRNHLKANF